MMTSRSEGRIKRSAVAAVYVDMRVANYAVIDLLKKFLKTEKGIISHKVTVTEPRVSK